MKPDRFEYMPDTVGITHEDDCHLHKAVVGLLRRQHRAYVKMVKAQGSWKTGDGTVWINEALLLAAFTRYAKGKGK